MPESVVAVTSKCLFWCHGYVHNNLVSRYDEFVCVYTWEKNVQINSKFVWLTDSFLPAALTFKFPFIILRSEYHSFPIQNFKVWYHISIQ